MTVSKVDTGELDRLAVEVQQAQSSIAAGMKGFSQAAAPSGTTFGNTSAGPTCMNAHNQAQSAMGSVLKAFDLTVAADAQRLRQALAAYKQQDAEAADRLLELNRNRLDVISTHLTKGDGEFAKDQGAQIDRLRSIAGDPAQGHTVIGGDFNTSQTSNNPARGAFTRLDGQGFNTDAGALPDGGTSASGQPIDHVMTRGLGSSQPTRWATSDDESDHDGQLIDIRMPNW